MISSWFFRQFPSYYIYSNICFFIVMFSWYDESIFRWFKFLKCKLVVPMRTPLITAIRHLYPKQVFPWFHPCHHHPLIPPHTSHHLKIHLPYQFQYAGRRQQTHRILMPKGRKKLVLEHYWRWSLQILYLKWVCEKGEQSKQNVNHFL